MKKYDIYVIFLHLVRHIYCLQETHFRSKDEHRLKVRGWEKMEMEMKTWVAILISDKTDSVIGDK